MSRKSTLILLFILAALGSCIKEEFDPDKLDPSLNLDPGLAVPVGFSTLQIEKYLQDVSEDSVLFIGDDGFLSVRYARNVVSDTMGELISIPPITFEHTELNNTGSDIILDFLAIPLVLDYDLHIPVTLGTDSAQVDSIRLLSGTLTTGIETGGLNGTIVFTFPGLQRNRDTLVQTTTTSQPDVTVDLTGYTIKCRQGVIGNNLIDCNVSLRIENTSGTIAAGEPIMSVHTDISGLMFETIYGNFDGFEISIPTVTYSPGVFNTIAEGSFEFAAPKIGFYFTNSIGVAGGIAFSQVEAVDQNQVHHFLEGPGVPTPSDPKIISYPNLVGETAQDSLIIDNTNSNLPEILGLNPDTIIITALASLNPPENNIPAFLRYDSRYSVDAEFELPIWGKAQLFLTPDTLNFDYLSTSLPVPREIDSLVVRIYITNQFPVSITPQIYLFDQGGALLDSIFRDDQEIVGASDQNGDGKVDPHTQDPINIGLSRTTIENLTQTHSLLTTGKIETTNFMDGEYVKFYADYFLQYKIALIAQLKINTGK